MEQIDQKAVFLSSEGNQWYRRNHERIGSSPTKDLVIELLRSVSLSPKKVLEVGCSYGLKTELFRQAFQSECWGIDPSAEAIEEGRKKYPHVTLQVATAEKLPFADNMFDTVMLGSCLCLCDRNDLFRIACEADRCLADGGILIVNDFYPPFPYKNPYIHHPGVYAYKLDYSSMFLWNPVYTEIAKVVYTHDLFEGREIPNDRVVASVLQKNTACAYPEVKWNKHE